MEDRESSLTEEKEMQKKPEKRSLPTPKIRPRSAEVRPNALNKLSSAISSNSRTITTSDQNLLYKSPETVTTKDVQHYKSNDLTEDNNVEPKKRQSRLMQPKSYKKSADSEAEKQVGLLGDRQPSDIMIPRVMPSIDAVKVANLVSDFKVNQEAKLTPRIADTLELKPKRSSIPMRKGMNLPMRDLNIKKCYLLDDVDREGEDPCEDEEDLSGESIGGVVSSESFEFLKGSRLCNSASIDGILSPATLQGHDLLPDFLTEYEAKRGKVETNVEEEFLFKKNSESCDPEQGNDCEEIFIPDEPFDGNIATSTSFHGDLDSIVTESMSDSLYAEHFSDGNILNPKKQEKDLEDWEMDGSNSDETASDMTQSVESMTKSMESMSKSVELMSRSCDLNPTRVLELARKNDPNVTKLAFVEALKQSSNDTDGEDMDEGMGQSTQDVGQGLTHNLNYDIASFAADVFAKKDEPTHTTDNHAVVTREPNSKYMEDSYSSALNELLKRPDEEEDEGMVRSTQEFGNHLAEPCLPSIAVYAADINRSYHQQMLPSLDKHQAFAEDALLSRFCDEISSHFDEIAKKTPLPSSALSITDDMLLELKQVKKERPISTNTTSSNDTGYTSGTSPTEEVKDFRQSFVTDFDDRQSVSDFSDDRQNREARIIDGKLYNFDIEEEAAEEMMAEMEDVSEENDISEDEEDEDMMGEGEGEGMAELGEHIEDDAENKQMECTEEIDNNESCLECNLSQNAVADRTIKEKIAPNSGASTEDITKAPHDVDVDCKGAESNLNSDCKEQVQTDEDLGTGNKQEEKAKRKSQLQLARKSTASQSPARHSSTGQNSKDSQRPESGRKSRLEQPTKPRVLPKKNVPSKIKAMIESSAAAKKEEGCVAEKEGKKSSSRPSSARPLSSRTRSNSKTPSMEKEEKPPQIDLSKVKSKLFSAPCKDPPPKVTRQPKKPNRWDAVSAKIAANLAVEKTKPKKKAEVKARVQTHMTLAAMNKINASAPPRDSKRQSRQTSTEPNSTKGSIESLCASVHNENPNKESSQLASDTTVVTDGK